MHQKHHERPKDEEGDIAELEKRRTWGRGCQKRRQRRAAHVSNPKLLARWSPAPFQAINPEFITLSVDADSQPAINGFTAPSVILLVH